MYDLDRLDVPAPDESRVARRRSEAIVKQVACRCSRRPCHELLEDLQKAPSAAALRTPRAPRLARVRAGVRIGLVDHDLGAGELRRALELEARERRLQPARAGPAPRLRALLRRPRSRCDRAPGRRRSASRSYEARPCKGERDSDYRARRSRCRRRRRARPRGRTRATGNRDGRCTRRRRRSRATSPGDPRRECRCAGRSGPRRRRRRRRRARASSRGASSRPTSTLPKKRKNRPARAVFSKARETGLISGWSERDPEPGRSPTASARQPFDEVDLDADLAREQLTGV